MSCFSQVCGCTTYQTQLAYHGVHEDLATIVVEYTGYDLDLSKMGQQKHELQPLKWYNRIAQGEGDHAVCVQYNPVKQSMI